MGQINSLLVLEDRVDLQLNLPGNLEKQVTRLLLAPCGIIHVLDPNSMS